MQGSFFASKVSKKKDTSRSLVSLPRGEDEQLDNGIKIKSSDRNFNQKEKLRLTYQELCPHWLFLLRQGFSLLLYGFGSKRDLLDSFAAEYMVDGGVLSVNGMSSALTVKKMLVEALCMLQRGSAANYRACSSSSLLAQLQQYDGGSYLYIVVHNIDGPALRNGQSQALLAELAACSCIRMAASVDHVSAPLLWDKQTAARFNWIWQDATTYAHYSNETAGVPPLMRGRREDNSLQGAANVLVAMTANAKSIFKLMAEQQLEEDEDSGFSFNALYKTCRERFLVHNEMMLQSFLTEFRDHKIILTRRGNDGQDLMSIPFDGHSLQALLKELEA